MSNQQTFFADATPLTVIENFPFAAGCFTGSAPCTKSYFLTTSSDLPIVNHQVLITIKNVPLVTMCLSLAWPLYNLKMNVIEPCNATAKSNFIALLCL